MKLTDIKRIIKEDFAEDEQSLIEKLSFSLNPLLEKLTNAFNKGIDFDNLNQEVLSFEVEVVASGKPKAETELKSNLRTRCQGLSVIRVENLSGNGLFPTASPFITFGLSGSSVQINNISGLPTGTRFRLTVISYG